MESIVITGAAGFIGTHLQKALVNKYSVTGIDSLEPENSASIQRSVLFPELVKASIHSNFLAELPQKPSVLIHLAAETGISKSLEFPDLYFHQNVEGTFNVLEQCRQSGVKYLIYASSSSVYSPNQEKMHETSHHGQQLSFYGTTKRMTETMVENYCRQFGMTAIGLRFFTVYGSWTRPDMAAYKFMSAIEAGKPVTLYNEGTVSRDFTHVSDIVNAIELLVEKIKQEKEHAHQIFNIGFGAPVSVKKYAGLIADNLEKELKSESAVLPKNELVSTYCDTSRLEAYIHYKPHCTLETGIREMTDWFKQTRYE